jgi:hypothetical protein
MISQNQMKKNIFAIIILFLLAALLYSYGSKRGPVVYNNENSTTTEPNTEIKPIIYKDLIQVDSPRVGQTIKSPLTVTGKARGNWYFEASFPVQVLDEDGTVLGSAPVQAQGEWMTAEYVPFKGTISFQAPKNPNAKLQVVFRKDNPSGLPENEDFVSVEANYSK